MEIDPQQVLALIKNPVSWVLGAWFARELWRAYKKRIKAGDDAINSIKSDVALALKDNSNELSKLTVAVMKLEMRLEQVDKFIGAVPKLQSDVNVLFERQRIMKDLPKQI